MVNIIDLVDSALVAEQRERASDGYMKKNHYARDFLLLDDDGMEGRCLRENFYEWFGFEKTNQETKSLYNFKSGYMLEDMVGNVIEKFHSDVWSMERGRVVMIQPEGLAHPIKGKIDFVFRSLDDSKPWTVIVEMKTSHGRGISNRKFGRRYTGPMKSHIMQASFYYQYADTTPELYLGKVEEELVTLKTIEPLEGNLWKHQRRIAHLKTELSRPERVDPDELVIFYLSREDFNRLQFSTCGDPESAGRGKAPTLFDALLMDDFRCFKALEKYMLEKKLPPRTYKDGPSRYPCSWCDYLSTCERDEGARI